MELIITEVYKFIRNVIPIKDIIDNNIKIYLFFHSFIQKIKYHEKNYKDELPDRIKMQDIGKLRYALYLVVHGNETEWMIPIQEALKIYLRHVLNAWNIPDVNVYALNHEDAQAKGLIKQYLPLGVLEQFKIEGLKDQVLQNRVEQWFKDNP